MKIPVQALIIKKMYDNSYDDLRKIIGIIFMAVVLYFVYKYITR